MEQIVLDACKQIGIDPSAVVESSIRIDDGGVVFIADLGIKGSPRFGFKRLSNGAVEYSRDQWSFTGLIGSTSPALKVPEVVAAPQPPVTVNVGFGKTQEMTPQKRAWEQRRKILKESGEKS